MRGVSVFTHVSTDAHTRRKGCAVTTPAYHLHRCYLCEQSYPAGEHAEHYAERHAPRLLLPAGVGTQGDATIRELFQRSANWPVLAADVMVLMHHGATALASAQEQVQSDGSVGNCLRELDDAVSYLILARQVLTEAVAKTGQDLLGPGGRTS